jgi:carbon starvation protein
MKQIVLNNQIDAVLTGIFMLVIAIVLIDAGRVCYQVLIQKKAMPLHETPYIPVEEG